jgi:hypothetical protein
VTQRLLTAAQVKAEFNLPSESLVRTMRLKGLKHISIGRAILYDVADVVAFLEEAKVSSLCQDRIAAPASSGSQSDRAGTSSGTRPAGKGSSLPARATAAMLKALSPTSSANDSAEAVAPGLVIRAMFPLQKS